MAANSVPFPSDHFSIWQIADGVFAAIATEGGAAISNAGIIDLGGRTLVFDAFMTPQAGRDLRLAAQQLTGREPGLVVNSHYHNDHIWGNQAFGPQTLFVSTAETLELMHASEEVEWARDVSASRFDEAKRQYETAASDAQRQDARLWMGYFGGLLEALPTLAVRFPDITFEDRLSIHGSSRSAELISFENCHTGSDAILLLREQGILFMGDLLFVGCHPYMDETDVYQLRVILEQLDGIAATTFVPGHGPLGTRPDIASNMRYIDMCLAAARRLVNAGSVSPEAIAREAPSGEFADWGLARFFTANLESLCSRLSAREPAD
jgi:glyoxylase-like metal-dependent hydrolase (beta-lactamase superfamily II)